TASVQMFRQIGGSLGVSILGAIFANQLAFRAAVIGHPEGTAGFSPGTLLLMPVAERDAMISAYAAALHPVFWVTAGLSMVACGLSFLLRESPLPGLGQNAPISRAKP